MTEIPAIVVLGLAAGSIYGLAAAGLALTFSTSGVFNFAHGSIAAVGAYAFHEATTGLGMHAAPAFLLATAATGVVCGLLSERVARRLTASPLHLRVVATVGLILVVNGVVEARYGTTTLYADRFLPAGTVEILGARVGVDRLLVVLFGTISVAGLHLLLVRTRTGLAMRAVVDEPDLLAEIGTDPTSVRRLSWVAGSSLAAASGILLAPSVGLEPLVLTFLVVQAFGGAALGRFTDPVAAYLGGLTIGVAGALTTRYLGDLSGLRGLPASIPFVILLLVLLIAPPASLAVGASGRRTTAQRSPIARATGAVPPAVVAAAGTILTAPLLVVTLPRLAGARLPVFTNGAALTIVFVSLSLLVNASGQVSLCHAAFAAIGAATFSHLSAGAEVPWGAALGLAAAATVPLGVLVAVPASRLSGLALAIATFGLGLAVERLLYGSGLLFGASGTRLVPRPDVLGLSGDRAYFSLVASIAVAVTAGVWLLLQGRFGRLLQGLGDDPRALAATGVSVSVTRVVVFSLSAALAGLGGALAAAANGSVTTVTHPPMQSLLFVAVLAIGGRGAVSAGVRAAAGFTLVPVYLEWIIGSHVSAAFGVTAVGIALLRSRPARSDAPPSPWQRRADGAAWRLERGPVQARLAAGSVR